ncbi:DUF2306 domain-containing protein [Luteimonas sp. A534]
MRPRPCQPGRLALLAVFSLACVATAAYAFAYLYMAFRQGDPFAENFAVSGRDVPAHFFGAGLALLLVPLQLSDAVRQRWPALHRIGGLLSAFAILVGGVSGLSLAQHAQGGWPSRIGFSLLSVLWLGTTANGIRLAIMGELARHRRWMAYSIALTSAAVTLRVILAVGGGMLQLPFMPVYITAAWASWLFNLSVCAWLLRAPRPRCLSAMAEPRPATPGDAGSRWAFRR